MSGNPEGGTVRCEVLDDGAIWHVLLATPKANIVDMDKAEQLCSIFERAKGERGLKAVLIEGEGPNFSFGASVPEHLPGQFEKMIPGFHKLFRRIIESSVFTLAAVRGQCLGGGLEVASFCNRFFASPDAKLGQPEIVLGVFPPAASVVLPERCGRGAAEHLCLTGKSVSAEEGLRIGLVDQIDDDPGAAALAYARKFLLPKSASSLRLGVQAVRMGWHERFLDELDRVEKLYMKQLMSTADAVEGLTAFVEKRDPAWSDR
jgi:cyclohexa-1,5-dienecarbonyl-CoA hydratase